jgi:hypothetical protein
MLLPDISMILSKQGSPLLWSSRSQFACKQKKFCFKSEDDVFDGLVTDNIVDVGVAFGLIDD